MTSYDEVERRMRDPKSAMTGFRESVPSDAAATLAGIAMRAIIEAGDILPSEFSIRSSDYVLRCFHADGEKPDNEATVCPWARLVAYVRNRGDVIECHGGAPSDAGRHFNVCITIEDDDVISFTFR